MSSVVKPFAEKLPDRRGHRRKALEAGKVTYGKPFDLKIIFLAKHAQHVVLIHFPIALFMTAIVFDVAAYWTKRRSLEDATYYNLLVAASSDGPSSGNWHLSPGNFSLRDKS